MFVLFRKEIAGFFSSLTGYIVMIVFLLALGLLIFGPKRLPELGSQLARAIREFQQMMRDDQPAVSPPAPPSAVATNQNPAVPPAQETVAAEPHQD